MIRKAFKKKSSGDSKLDKVIAKYNLPRQYLSINRRSITWGIFWGLLIGFIPMPFQMVAVLALTPFTQFNVPIAISMVWLSNPITMPFMYYMEYQTGNFILGKPPLPDVQLTLDWFSNHWDDIIVPLYVGTLPYSLVVSALVALTINWCWIRSVRKHQEEKCKRNQDAR